MTHKHEDGQECEGCRSGLSKKEFQAQTIERLKGFIETEGMAIINIEGTCAYSVGRAAKGQPELYLGPAMGGFANRIFNDINIAGIAITHGGKIPAGTIEGLHYDVYTFNVTQKLRPENVGYANMSEFSEGRPVAFFELVFADDKNLMPWEPSYDTNFDQRTVFGPRVMREIVEAGINH